ncbi:MAG: cob(I)yrinic acid a,c-diamide adenosyltransferase [Bacteroidota bacterium]
MKIYTRTGDNGETSLLGGRRVPKDALRVEAYGAVDELNAHLGLIVAGTASEKLRDILVALQHMLFLLGAELATPPPSPLKGSRIVPEDISTVEHLIDDVEETLQPLTKFILPGGTTEAASLHIARTVCRRAERACIRLSHAEEVESSLLIYLNRLSDLLFVLARAANQRAGTKEIEWSSRSRDTRET